MNEKITQPKMAQNLLQPGLLNPQTLDPEPYRQSSANADHIDPGNPRLILYAFHEVVTVVEELSPRTKHSTFKLPEYLNCTLSHFYQPHHPKPDAASAARSWMGRFGPCAEDTAPVQLLYREVLFPSRPIGQETNLCTYRARTIPKRSMLSSAFSLPLSHRAGLFPG